MEMLGGMSGFVPVMLSVPLLEMAASLSGSCFVLSSVFPMHLIYLLSVGSRSAMAECCW